jgi:hypothetical protein
MVKEWRGRYFIKIDFIINKIFLFKSLAIESRIQQTYEDDVATLVIKKVKLEDDGEYICRATNDEGSDTSSGQLTVKGILY